jgi:predicted enzyme related to lactoylglutathione lyase
VPIRDSVPAGAPVWIELSTSDPQRAKDFYAGLFGWTFIDAGPDYGNYVNFAQDGVLIAGMTPNQEQGLPDGWTTYLASDDAKSTADAVLTAGGQILLEPMPVRDLGTMAVVLDPSGAVVGVWQPGEHRGYGLTGEAGTPAWLELHTHDYGAAVRFYQRAFGWSTTVISDSDDFRYTVYEKDEQQYAGILDATAFLPAGVPSNWQVYLQVDDIDATLVQLPRLGGSVRRPAVDSPYGRVAEVSDPTGAAFRLLDPPVR